MSLQLQDLYDFEKWIELGIQTVLEADPWDLSKDQQRVFTTQDTGDFQKVRPRVELMFATGAWDQQREYPLDAQDGLGQVRREVAWQGELHVQVISESDITVHTPFRTAVRAAMSSLVRTVNVPAILPYHNISRVTTRGSTPAIKPEENLYLTTMIFGLQFSINATAWPQIGQ